MNERNLRTETRQAAPMLLVEHGTGRQVLVPGASMTQSAFEYDCPTCGREHTARGVVGALLAYGGACPEAKEAQP